jgi:thiol:disulfide interchange protein
MRYLPYKSGHRRDAVRLKIRPLGQGLSVPAGCVLWFLLIVFAATQAAAGASAQQELTAEVILSKKAYAPRETVIVALHVIIPESYHLYANPLGPGIGKPVVIRVRASKGIQWLDLYKSPPGKFTPEIGDWVWAYEKETFFFCKGVLAKNPPPVVRSWISLQGLVCHTSCVQVKKAFDFEIRTDGDGTGLPFEGAEKLRSFSSQYELMNFNIVNDTLRAQAETNDSLFGRISLMQKPPSPEEKTLAWDYDPVERKMTMNLLLAILFGFLAGIILNVMPCVLPVLGIKILSLAQTGGASRRTALLRSLVFSAGMMSVFMMLAALASFAHMSWGQHFQSPWFLIALILITVVFSLGMFDIYILPIPTNDIADLEKKSGRGAVGDFMRGMLATLLATPCSGPFLGATLAWTLTQSTLVIFLVFGSIGLGMAFPYVLLSSNKTLLLLMPRPGRWMNDFKNLMGFLLLGASVYLLFGLPKDMVAATVSFCLVAAFTIVIYSRLAPFGSSLSRKTVAAFVAGLVLATGGYYSIDALYHARYSTALSQDLRHHDIRWEDFSSLQLKAAHAEGRNVVVDFTANWCLNCQYNLMTVLSDDVVMDLFQKKDVMAVKADLTWTNPAAESLLHNLGSRSVPFLAVFRGDDPYHPIIMRDILNKGDFIRVLKALPEK